MSSLFFLLSLLHHFYHWTNSHGQSQTKKKIAATDAIFEQVNQVNAAADRDPATLRISMDAKATVKVGDFSRGGKKRVGVKPADHDFRAKAKVIPLRIFLPEFYQLLLSLVPHTIT